MNRCGVACLLLPVLIATACSQSGEGQTHGPVVDAGEEMATDHLPDGSSDMGPADAGKEAGHHGKHDAAEDAPPESAPPKDASKKDAPGTCKGTVALAGGTSSVGFGATSVNGAAWTVTPLPTASTASNPALAAYDGGFMAVFTAAAVNTLESSLYASASWSAAADADGSSCSAAPTALGSVGLAAIGTTLHSVYLGTDYDYFHGTYSSGSWDCESDPLTPSGGMQSFGPSAPAAATVGTSLYAAYDGNDGHVYVQPWSTSGWGASVQIAGSNVGTISPSMIALTGGSSDLLVVYENAGDNKLYWAARSGGTWSTPGLTDMNAYTLQPVSLAPLPAGAAVVAFLGTDGNPYSTTFDPTASTPWSSPAPILTGGQTLTTPPAVATGICGADAIAAVIQPSGVETVTLSSGKWSSPELVSGTAAMSYASIATSP